MAASRSRNIYLLGVFIACQFLALGAAHARQTSTLSLHLRQQVETSPGSGRYHTLTREAAWEPRRTAIIICDMWDQHWCRGATERVSQMAPRMNDVVQAARRQGVFIIHCPSDTMKFYEGAPQRARALAAKPVETKEKLQSWQALNPEREPRLPIDDSDGGCDCTPRCTEGSPWKRQIATIEIAAEDAITDGAEAYYLLEERGIDNVIVMGVHTNMCVLGRPFSIRQMVTLGKNVVLMRDMTDTMYCSRSEPFVNHFTGTDLVVSHIERHWCPTIASTDIVGGDEFRFPADKRKTLAMLIGEDEYQTEKTLPEFALRYLGRDFRTLSVFSSDVDRNDFPGIEAVNGADALLVSVRRRLLSREQLAHVRDFVAAGKPVIGIRTASHAFAPRDGEIPEGHEAWPEFDRQVLGGNYTGHHGNHPPDGPRTIVHVAEDAARDALTAGLRPTPWVVPSWLYKTSPLADGAHVLLVGEVEGNVPPEPVAWTFQPDSGNRVFYTSLGHPEEFQTPEFRRLLINGVYWATGTDGAETVETRPKMRGQQ